MTKDQQILTIWGGGALVALIVGGVILSGRAGSLEAARTEADALHASYAKLYPEEGRPSQEALDAARRLSEHQSQARKSAEEALVAVLPDDYRRTDVNQSGSRLSSDLAALRQRAQRQKVVLPAQLPFEGGFENDEVKRSLQLTQLYLYRTIVDQCMDVGVTRITTVKEGVGYRDASGTFAVIPCEFAVEGNYEAMVALIDAMRARHVGGFGIRDLRLGQGAQTVQANFLATMIIINDPAWNLNPIAVSTPTTGGVRSGTATSSSGPSSSAPTPVPSTGSDGGRKSRLSGGG